MSIYKKKFYCDYSIFFLKEVRALCIVVKKNKCINERDSVYFIDSFSV